VVFFGGAVCDDFCSFFGDTWHWDGGGWHLLHRPGPSDRCCMGMVADRIRHGVLLYGGESSTEALADTWYWRDGRWTLVDVASPPGVRQSMGMAYDPARGRVVMYGGFTYPDVYYTDTWVWDGVTWSCAAGCAG
jgi:hypothetical protein